MILLSELYNKISIINNNKLIKLCNNTKIDPFISDIYTDSREVKCHSIFVCMHGNSSDGHAYIYEAVNNGAVALITERDVDIEVPYILAKNIRNILGMISSVVYGNPSSRLLMCGITGTNGKSTTTFMLRHILDAAGTKTGILGTIAYDDGVLSEGANRTTPESSAIQRYLSRMLQNGCRACVMEVSSHGLSLGRINGCRYDGGIFTNLSEEHLDFHGDIESYFLAKRTLFQLYMKSYWTGVANGDDFYGRRLYNEYNANIILYGLDSSRNNFSASNIFCEKNITHFTLFYEEKKYKASLPFLGKHNVYNALSAVSFANTLGIDVEASLSFLQSSPRVPGRFESYYLDNGVRVVIDFAHTPFALQNLLGSIRELSGGSIISVFGHGGGRFAENRPQLGKIAARYADKIIITSDNPRSEDPVSIANQIYDGIVRFNPTLCVSILLDRKEAVYKALNDARDGDIVVISGKGPEREIIFEDHRILYNDFDAMISWSQKAGVKIL